MTVHLLRDFLTVTSAIAPATNMYLLSLFAYGVLGYTIDSSVSFDLTSSNYLKASYDVSGTLQLGSINLATGSEYFVAVPLAAYTVSSADVNRILVTRSQLYPKSNSGLFRVTAVNVPANAFVIDYRSTEYPPVESSTLTWRLFEAENMLPNWSTGSNGSTGYNTRGASTASRIMLNSPGGYHVRMCLESVPDRSGTIPGGFSIAPGAGSVQRADFNDVDGHLHGPMWFNTTSSLYRGSAVGLSPRINSFEWTTGQWRLTALGDDVNGTTLAINRNVSFPTGGNGWAIFGIPEDEALPLPTNVIDRVFVMGYGTATPNLSWHSGFFNDGHAQGMAWNRYGRPVPCIMSSYADVTNIDPHVRNLSSSINTAYTSKTELMDVDLLVGVMLSQLSPSGSKVHNFAPNRLGRVPFVRMGRSNYGQWTLTPDQAWLHAQDGIYVPWSGPLLTGSTTGSANAIVVVSSSVAAGDGIQFFEPNPSMSDPIVTVIPEVTSDKDASRYRKTYSYFRQPSTEVRVIKVGSNVAKP